MNCNPANQNNAWIQKLNQVRSMASKAILEHPRRVLVTDRAAPSYIDDCEIVDVQTKAPAIKRDKFSPILNVTPLVTENAFDCTLPGSEEMNEVAMGFVASVASIGARARVDKQQKNPLLTSPILPSNKTRLRDINKRTLNSNPSLEAGITSSCISESFVNFLRNIAHELFQVHLL